MPRSFLVKKVKCDDTKSYHYRSSRDIITAYDESFDSIKALTPYTPCVVPSHPLSVRVSNGYISELVVPSLPQDAKTAQVEEDPMVMQIQPAHVEIHPHAGCQDNHVHDSDHFSDTSSNSALDLTIDRDLKKDIESRVTIGYTYDAFFISDGRSRKKNSFGIPERITKQRYTCSECGKDYATSSNLSRHKQTHRSLDSQLAKTCPHCDKVYVSMPALSMHILTHELKHKCEICGKAFSRPWLLHGHKRSHTGEKPYGCAHCGKAFADRSNLRAHMQTHSAFKHYTCKRCNKSFALKSYLNKHYESACIKDDSDSTSVCSMGSSQS